MAVPCSERDDTCGQNVEHAKERVQSYVLNLFWPRTARFGPGYYSKVLVIVCFILTDVDCDLEEFPKNEALPADNRVEFRCKSNLGVRLKWFMQPNATSKRQDLFNGFTLAQNASSYCQVEQGEPGKYYLHLVTRDESAQTYYCHELGSHEEVSAELIVINNETHCEREMTETHAVLKCSIKFRGNWAPELEWSLLGEVITDGVNTTVVPNEMVSSTLVVPRNVTDETYICTTKFHISGKPQQTTRTNVPDYRTSSSLVVEAKLINKNKEPELDISDGGKRKNIVIIAVASVVAVVVVVLVLTFIFWNRNKKKGMKEENYKYANQSFIVHGDEMKHCPISTTPACDRLLRHSRP